MGNETSTENCTKNETLGPSNVQYCNQDDWIEGVWYFLIGTTILFGSFVALSCNKRYSFSQKLE